MTLNWTNHDRAAFNEWLNSDLGSKFLRYFENQRPKSPSAFDVNALAMYGASASEFERLIKVLDDMRRLPVGGPTPQPHVDTETD